MKGPSLDALMERAADAERAGEWDRARQLFGELFQRGRATGALECMADALRGESRVWRRLERYEEAEELAELSYEIAERNELRQAAARAVNMVAVLRFVRRDWCGARALYEQALERGLEVGDDELIGYVCQNLGVVANIQGDLREARIRYLECIGAAVRSGNELVQAMVYNNLGMVCTDLDECMEAEVFFNRGIELAQRANDQEQLAKLYANRAEPLIRTGEFGRARDSLDRAELISRRLKARLTLVDIARFRGMMARREGDVRVAERQIARALQLAGSDSTLERAETLEELAQLYHHKGQVPQARAALARARDIFRSLGAERDAARAEAQLRAWSAGEGSGGKMPDLHCPPQVA